MKNTFGSDLSLTIFGESHGRAIGAVLDGMAAGLPVDETFLAACMDKRRARGDGLSTPRVEADAVQLLSGVVNGRTTGTAIALMIENTNTRSGDYAKTADLLRPGHADYTAYAKYHGFQDARGGGHFSGRVTAALVAGGAIVLSALRRAGIDITTHIAECAGIADTRFAQDDAAQLSAQVEALASKPEGFAVLDETVEEPMKAAIRAAGAEGDSVGGMLETAILGLPAGIGEPYFDSVESEIAHLVFSVPAVKGIEFGTGFGFAGMRGSEANDAFRMTPEGAVVTATNHNAGVPHRGQTHTQHLQAAGYSRLSCQKGRTAVHSGPSRPLHRAQSRHRADLRRRTGCGRPAHGTLRRGMDDPPHQLPEGGRVKWNTDSSAQNSATPTPRSSTRCSAATTTTCALCPPRKRPGPFWQSGSSRPSM